MSLPEQDNLTLSKHLRLGHDNCFLCGTDLDAENRTVEHVLPKWLQQRFNLWDHQLNLLNGTSIPYRQLTIPSCRTCNGGPLALLEREIATGLEGGYESFAALDELRIFQWVGKLFLGILIAEGRFRQDLRIKRSGPIVPKQMIEEYNLLHFFLQSIRLPFHFRDFTPWSVFRFRLKPAPPEIDQFDYRDNPLTLCFAMRLGEIGFVINLLDNGSLRAAHESDLGRFRAALGPLQFLETVAACFYQSSLLNRTPKYIMQMGDGLTDGRPTEVAAVPLGGLSGRPVYEDWDTASYATYVATILGLPDASQILVEPNMFQTWLFDEHGNLKPELFDVPVATSLIDDQVDTTRAAQ